MRNAVHPYIAPASPLGDDGRRAILYLVDDPRGEVGDFALTALSALRGVADRIVAVVDPRMGQTARTRLSPHVDDIVDHEEGAAGPSAYGAAIRTLGSQIASIDELVLTANSWYGPVQALDPVLARMSRQPVHLWQMTDNVDGPTEAFPDEGFPSRDGTWLWLAVRRQVLSSPEWAALWKSPPLSEQEVVDGLRAAGFTAGSAFPATGYPRGNPALFAPDLLLADGFPFLSRSVFAQYPPFLDRHAVFGRELLHQVADYGWPLVEIWRDLARNVPPKALNTIAGMLEVLPDAPGAYDPDRPFRIAVVAFVPEVAFVDELLERVSNLPNGFDLIITTGDGGKAREIEIRVGQLTDPPFAMFETRVSWVRRGRDKAALLIACRDVILSDRYDLIVKVHGRESSRKTDNMREYSRRYFLDNLLDGRDYVLNVLELFQREPGLGVVFPPMIHIGNAIMGRGWGAYRVVAVQLCERLGVRVPLDRVTPLAPYGGMWIGRPEAIRPLAQERWTEQDYGRAGRKKYVELGRVQERLVPLVAGELGYHCRTVLTRDHASISHTSLEFKVDQLFSTTRGYPVEQIRFMHRVGPTGHGGVVALTRMYLRVNHPALSRVIQPLYRLLYRTFTVSRRLRLGVRRAITGESDERTDS